MTTGPDTGVPFTDYHTIFYHIKPGILIFPPPEYWPMPFSSPRTLVLGFLLSPPPLFHVLAAHCPDAGSSGISGISSCGMLEIQYRKQLPEACRWCQMQTLRRKEASS